MPPRRAVVDALVHEALMGMEQIEGSSGDEIVSACFTLTRRCMASVLEMNPACRPVIVEALQSLLLDCADGMAAN